MPFSAPPHLAGQYDAWHTGLEGDFGGNSPWHRLVLKYIDPSRDISGSDVLEIGCGRGGFAARLAQTKYPPRLLIGADFSQVAVNAASRQFTAPTLRWEVQDVLGLTYPDSSFDTVVSCETIEHVTFPQRALEELGRILRPGGKLFLTTPNYFGLLGLYRMYLRLRGRRFTEAGQPINHLTLLPLTMLWIRRAGLRLEKWDAIGHYLPFPGRPPISLRLDGVRPLSLLGLHSIFVAVKPGDRSQCER